MDALMLSRIQFAFTVGYHFIFVPISIGLALMVVFSERRYFKSGIPADKAASNFWIKLFTTTFAIGVATGLTMEFAFGTNWADSSRFVGSIFGAPSAVWILIANSWQHTPAGYTIEDGRAVLTSFWAAALNPSFAPRYVHTIVACVIA